MEFKQIVEKRRSVRKFDGRPVPREVVDRLLAAALSAPSSRNSRSSHFLVVDNRDAILRMAGMRDYGAAFMKDAPLAVVIFGDASKTDLWRENCAIAATLLQLSCVDEGLASCWVHVDGRPRFKDAPDGESAADHLRAFLPFPEGCRPFCVVAIGYSDFQPAPLPASDDRARVEYYKE
ncbi:MAG: nitroreductase family protein [Alistipes sp.]|nr:nitroreductase family protein [Alistipes sp.]